MSSQDREVRSLLRQIRTLLLIGLFALVMLILIIAFPYRQMEILGVGIFVFLLCVAAWAILTGIDSAQDRP